MLVWNSGSRHFLCVFPVAALEQLRGLLCLLRTENLTGAKHLGTALRNSVQVCVYWNKSSKSDYANLEEG